MPAALGAQLFELPVHLHHVGMLWGVLQQQFGATDAQLNLFFIEAGQVSVRCDGGFGRAGSDLDWRDCLTVR